MALRLKHRDATPVYGILDDREDAIETDKLDLYSETVQAKLNADGYTDEQESGLATLLSGANVFLTGNAGTGKSWLLNQFIEKQRDANKQLMIVAPTGIAAINIDGATIHRTFKAPIGPLVSKPKSCAKELLSADTLICDEISMCRIDLFDYMMYQVVAANRERRKRGQADLQVVVCGDFFQLSPVITDRDREVLQKVYTNLGKGYAFQSEYWDMCCFKIIKLVQIVRQSNMEFQRHLNGIRMGDASSIRYFNDNSAMKVIDNAITVSGTNKQVEEINSRELSKLSTKSKRFISSSEGEVRDSDKVAPSVIELKAGARVMMLVNDQEEKYQNGSLGTVKDISKDTVTVLLDTGDTVNIGEYTWEILSYSMKNGRISKNVVGKYTQLPLKVAYAITIHKSQGQTYDAVNIYPKCWDSGQLYVALSRCKSIDKMYLMEKIYNNYLVTSNEVLSFYNNM